ncbi:hypothetical protein ACFZAM_15555 [Streptomyces sp. NPDC008079]|uniref:hypothetical protein n=1 Tax=Streptomyces sp. NPDC008079 TaxID=3364806 RepID=UPI0036F190EA
MATMRRRPIRRSTWARIGKRMREDANRVLIAVGSVARVPEKLTLHGLRDWYAVVSDQEQRET